MAKMPVQKPGKSKQDYGTPPAFLDAVKSKLHIYNFALDIAASSENTVSPNYYTEELDAFKHPWNAGDGTWSWLNPPFGDIYPWVERACREGFEGAHIAVLVPLSISEWWTDWVDNKAYVFMLKGRITFVGQEDAYPKDCALLLYTPILLTGYEIWDWKS